MRSEKQKINGLILLCCLGATVVWGQRGQVGIARDGQAQAVIVVPTGWTNVTALPKELVPRYTQDPLKLRGEVFRDSIKDLALYLGKMSGSTIEIVEGLPAGEKRTPIYIGAAAQKVFGPVGITKAGLFGFRVVADRGRGIGLYGESEYGTSYAIYELLHRLGCRWFMPTELGEVVPATPTLTVPEMDLSLAPATEFRGMWQGGSDWLRRNRMGGDGGVISVNVGQGALESYITAEQRKAHPEWCLHVNGQPSAHLLRWTHPGVANAIADAIIQQIDTTYAPVFEYGLGLDFGLNPGDYVIPADDPFEAKADPDPRVWEPAAGRWSVTDRYILLVNRVAERVGQKYPTVRFGGLAYVNISMPPAKYLVHPNFGVTIAPIDFNRHHPMDWPDHPNEFWLRDMVEGWGKKVQHLGAYWYGMNLAEVNAPNPFITKWGTDIGILLENNLSSWEPETMGAWDSMLPGYYLAARMTFYPEEKPEEILRDLWTKFYGAAAEPMGRYWHRMDRAWVDANEYAGAHWGYLKMFTPEVMAGARADIDEALARCRTIPEYRRVKLIDDMFALFELYMKMRRDWAAAKFAGLATDYNTYRVGLEFREKRLGLAGTRYGWDGYPDAFIGGAYRDATRMDKEFARVGAPMLEWKWRHNPILDFDALPWTAPDYDDAAWPTTHVVRDTWSSLGHHKTMTEASANRSGRMTYRTSQKLPAVPQGKKVFLWIGSTDGSAKLFVNGRHVKYIVPEKTRRNEKGDQLEAFSGYCAPAQFDVTDALIAGENQITILCDRYNLNELGTGGLMGPVVIYRDK
jgi:hypothetical protein